MYERRKFQEEQELEQQESDKNVDDSENTLTATDDEKSSIRELTDGQTTVGGSEVRWHGFLGEITIASTSIMITILTQ